MADAEALKASVERRAGSSPATRTLAGSDERLDELQNRHNQRSSGCHSH